MNFGRYIISVNSVWQIIIAVCLLFTISFLLIKRATKKRVEEENSKKNKKEIRKETKKQLCVLIKKFFCKSSGKFNERLIKTYKNVIDAYAEAMKDKSLIGLAVALSVSIVFLLIVNAIWEFLYYDTMFLTLDSQLSSGDAIELFVGTVLSLLLAIMTWRLDSQIRKQDENNHNREESSQRKRELAGNELLAKFCFSKVKQGFNCSVILKNKNSLTVLPAYLDVISKKTHTVFNVYEPNKSGFIIDEKNVSYKAEQICINFNSNDIGLSEDFFLKPICFYMFKDEQYFSLDLEFSVIDNSVYEKKDKKEFIPIEIKSSHIFWISSPLKQLSENSFEFDCEVVSKLTY